MFWFYELFCRSIKLVSLFRTYEIFRNSIKLKKSNNNLDLLI